MHRQIGRELPKFELGDARRCGDQPVAVAIARVWRLGTGGWFSSFIVIASTDFRSHAFGGQMLSGRCYTTQRTLTTHLGEELDQRDRCLDAELDRSADVPRREQPE